MGAKDVQMTISAIDKASGVISGIAATAERSFGSIQSVLAGAGLAAPLAAMIKGAHEWGSTVSELVERTGMAEESAGILLGIGKTLGMSGEAMGSAFIKMAKSASSAQDSINGAAAGTEDASNVYSRFGIVVQDANKKLLPAEQILKNIAEVHRKLPDGIEKTNMELAIFGKKGAELHDLLNMPISDMDRLAEKFKRIGLASEGTADKWKELGIKTNELGLSWTALEVQLGNKLLPELEHIVDKANQMADAYGKLDENTQIAIESSAKFAAEMGVFKVLLAGLVPGWAGVAAKIALATDALNDWIDKSLEARGYADTMSGENNWWGTPKYGPVKVGLPGDWEGAGLATGQKNPTDRGGGDRAAGTLKTTQDLQNEILKIQGNTLQITLNNIAKEAAEFKKAKLNELDIAKYTSAAQAKAYEDAYQRVRSAMDSVGGTFQGAYGAAISKVEAAMKAGGDRGTYWREASDALKEMQDELTRKNAAIREVASSAGYDPKYYQSGMFDAASPQSQVGKALESLNKAMLSASLQSVDYLKTIAQNTSKETPKNAGGSSTGGPNAGGSTAGGGKTNTSGDPFASKTQGDKGYSGIKKENAGTPFSGYQTFAERTRDLLDNPKISGIQRMEVTNISEIPAALERRWPGSSQPFRYVIPGSEYRNAPVVNVPITVNVSGITPETRQQIQNEMAAGLEQALGRAQNNQIDARY